MTVFVCESQAELGVACRAAPAESVSRIERPSLQQFAVYSVPQKPTTMLMLLFKLEAEVYSLIWKLNKKHEYPNPQKDQELWHAHGDYYLKCMICAAHLKVATKFKTTSLWMWNRPLLGSELPSTLFSPLFPSIYLLSPQYPFTPWASFFAHLVSLDFHFPSLFPFCKDCHHMF